VRLWSNVCDVCTPIQAVKSSFQPSVNGISRLPVCWIGQFSLPAANKNTMPRPRRPPVSDSCRTRVRTEVENIMSGELPQELEITSTLSAMNVSAAKNFESEMASAGPLDSHLMGSSRQPGAAPTVSAASTSAATTPAHAVPWLAPA
jgi:hypothetical protein